MTAPVPSQGAPMRAADFDYDLPGEMIAQTPVEPRDHSRLLVVHRAGGRLEHRRFFDLPSYLNAGDLLVVNETRVIPARLLGKRETGGGGRVEILLVRPENPKNARTWIAMVRPSRRVPPATVVVLDAPDKPRVIVGARRADGTRSVTLPEGFVLNNAGHVPLPPYIKQSLSDPERYQTVYAAHPGSVAAPTAGLHFTPDLLDRIRAQGVGLAKVTLDVGPGTFRPVQVDDPRDHDLGTERYVFPADAARAITETRERGGRVIAVGTTSVRTVETVAMNQGVPGLGTPVPNLVADEDETGLMILPGFEFRLTDALITNFHLPRSTLLMLVAAFGGKELIDRVYRAAVAEQYRFYSFGDAMLVL